MRRITVTMVVLGVVLTACGDGGTGEVAEDDNAGGTADTATGGDEDDASGGAADADGGGGDGGEIVDPQPPGQARVSVDGQEWTLTEPGAGDCSMAADAITFSFRIGDNEITLGAGANLYDTGWLGSIELRVADPEGADGPVTYFHDLAANGDGIAIDGDSMSYVGPMQKRPPNDGTNPPPEDVGDGTISVTCD